MEKRMSLELGMRPQYRKISVFALGLSMVFTAVPMHAQADAQKILIEKARSLQARGRDDVAAQVYRQILLADPNNIEAISGLARYYKLTGKEAESSRYLEQLRMLNPNDPNIAKIQALPSNGTRDTRLAEAGRLAQTGKPDAAMAIYRALYGDTPPDGDLALAYYETEFATADGKVHAIEGLRSLSRRYPHEAQYAITLGRLLTYEPRTRLEGIRVLRMHEKLGPAQAALRQAYLWEVHNPEVMPLIREYLKEYPDQELEAKFMAAESQVAQQLQGALSISPEERAAYKALDLSQLDEAKQRFQDILQKQPENPRAMAGLGFLHMKEGNYAEAIDAFEKAEKNGLHARAIENALTQSRFWLTMREGAKAYDQGQTDLAIEKYRTALKTVPNSPEALEGLAGVFSATQQYAQAIDIYQQCIKLQPNASTAWGGLFMAQALNGNTAEAMATQEHFPQAVRTALEKNPRYLGVLSSVYKKLGREADANRALQQGLALPLPENGSRLDALQQRAALLSQAKEYDQAEQVYSQLVADFPQSKTAWQGLIDSLHQAHKDGEAVAAVERIPQELRENLLQDPNFLAVLAASYQQQNRLEIARGFLERAVRIQNTAGVKPSVPLQLQLAAVELLSGSADDAFAMYRTLLTGNPERADAWKGLLASLHQIGRDQEALQQIDQIPLTVRSSLELDIEYQQTIAGIYAATGRLRMALAAMSQVQAHYAIQHIAPPADVDVQNAWLLYNLQDDRDLYPVLMRLGARRDLTSEQRDQVQRIWGNWSVRRANQAIDAGDSARALAILDAAAQALPGNLNVSRVLAGGYARAGKPAFALKIYQSLDWTNAVAADYQGAIGAALAVNNRKIAQAWLLPALEKYPHDASILALAARYEQAYGSSQRAAAYWRASLQAMPRSLAADRLAQELAAPLPEKHLPNPQDLASLLDPNSANEQRQSPLPGYSAAFASEGTQEPRIAPVRISNSPVTATALPSTPSTEEAALKGLSSPKPANLETASADTSSSLASVPQQAQAFTQQLPAFSSGSVSNMVANSADPVQGAVALPSPATSKVVASDPRQEAEDQLAAIEGGHSGWFGGTGFSSHRSGDAGYDRLTSLEAPFEASAPLGNSARLTVVTKPVFLDAGQADGSSKLRTTNGIIAQPIGTQSSTDTNPPAQQNAAGIGGELQLAAPAFSMAVGYTPSNFLVANVLGRLQIHPAGGPLSFSFTRDSVKDTQLSYAGLRDPGSISNSYSGNIWGGVVANSGDVQFAKSDAGSGYYVGVGGQYLTGRHVETNHRIHGNAGAYWRVYSLPEYGALTIGGNFFGMSYAHNLRGLTYGMGGYFSPQAYFLANLPITWNGHYKRYLSYNIIGSFGLQAFQEDRASLFPLDKNIEQYTYSYAALPAHTSVGGNYDFHAEIARSLNDHWFVGGFASLNNSRDYNSQTGGFFVRYLFRPQAPVTVGPTGIFPHDGLRPLLVP